MSLFRKYRQDEASYSFTIINWVKAQQREISAIKELDIKNSFGWFGVRSMIDAALVLLLPLLTHPLMLLMNADVSNPFFVILAVILMIIPLFLPFLFVFRGFVFSILQIELNKKWTGILGLILTVLSFVCCVLIWIYSLIII